MIFTLEPLQAQQGDSLVLHFGPTDAPKFIVVDGGPGGTWNASLRPRLEELRTRWAPEGALPIEIVMVSHIDDDHIHGVLDFTSDLVDARTSPTPAPFDLHSLWHNSFNDVVGDDEAHLTAPAAAGAASVSSFVLASVGQGRRLRDNANALQLSVNQGNPLMLAGATANFDAGLELKVVGPLHDEIVALQRDWDKHVKAKPQPAAAVAEFLDESVYNLSSIVVLATMNGRTMLLTGDARGDLILDGLEQAGIATPSVHVDVLKLPHHGSIRNVAQEFFDRITADHYVISANGRDGNPESETLDLIAAARGEEPFTIYLTNHDGDGNLRGRLDAFAGGVGPNVTLKFLGEPGPIRVDLGDPVDY
jgi:hypothetical protein